MPNINRSRTRINSQFKTQLDTIPSENLNDLVVEDGTIIEYENVYYVSINGDWEQFAPINNAALNTGWARYNDTQYNISNPYNFSTSAFFVPNNGRIIIDNYNLNAYNGTEFTLEKNCTYALTIAFKAHINSNNGHLTINLSCNRDTDYSRIGDVIVFPKGNGIEHTFSRMFNFYANDNVVLDGLKIKMQSSHGGSIYDVMYFIEKLSHG